MARFSFLSGAVTSAALLALSACGESTPSESTAEKYIKQDLANCSPIGLENFQKVNGFFQQDGSYIVDVKYILIFKPKSDLKKYIDDYKNKSPSLEKEISSLRSDVSKLLMRSNSVRSTCTYNPDYSDDPKLASSNDMSTMRDLESTLYTYVRENKGWEIRHSGIRPHYRDGTPMPDPEPNKPHDDAQISALQEQVQAIQARIDKEGEYRKGKEEETSRKSMECTNGASAIDAQAHKEGEELDRKIEELDAYINNIGKAFHEQCVAIPANIGGLDIFGKDYLLKLRNGENLSIEISQRIPFVKSDNGWVAGGGKSY